MPNSLDKSILAAKKIGNPFAFLQFFVILILNNHYDEKHFLQISCENGKNRLIKLLNITITKREQLSLKFLGVPNEWICITTHHLRKLHS